MEEAIVKAISTLEGAAKDPDMDLIDYYLLHKNIDNHRYIARVITRVDACGPVIVDCTDALESIIGYSRESVNGTCLSDYMPDGVDMKRVVSFASHVENENGGVKSNTVIHRDGSEVRVTGILFPIGNGYFYEIVWRDSNEQSIS